MAPRQSSQQARRRRIANGISKKWQIERQSKRPRGLVNIGNNCYRHAALQPLLHLPRFVNWIKKHNRGNHWPCHANDPNRVLPSDPSTLQVLEDEIGKAKKKGGKKGDEHDDMFRGCTPCLLKRLMIGYWGNIDIGGQPAFAPNRFPHQHEAIFLLHKLAERWYCIDPPGLYDRLELLPAQAQRANATRVARQTYMTAQQDSDDFSQRIFDGIQHSYDLGTVNGAARQGEYDSLLHVRTREVRTCENCDATRSDNTYETLGIRIIPDAYIMNDTVEDALARYFEDSTILPCDGCPSEKHTTQSTRRTILASPEYLRIQLDLVQQMLVKQQDKFGDDKVDSKTGEPIMVMSVVKNTNPIPIPDIIDLTAHMDIPATIQDPYPVRYKLVSATYHDGTGFNAGHYTASVTGPALPFRTERPQFFCNDATITNLPPTDAHPNAITENPMQGDFNATTLYYERITPTSISVAKQRKTADQMVIDEGRARRRNNNSEPE